MKKSLLLLTIIAFIGLTSLNAQLNQGNIMAGLSTTFSGNSWYSEGLNPGAGLFNLGFSTVKDLDDDEIDAKFAAFNFQPRIGYFVIDNLAIGLDLMAGIVREKDPDDSDTWTVTTLGAGPFVRYYYPWKKFILLLNSMLVLVQPNTRASMVKNIPMNRSILILYIVQV